MPIGENIAQEPAAWVYGVGRARGVVEHPVSVVGDGRVRVAIPIARVGPDVVETHGPAAQSAAANKERTSYAG